MGPIPGAKALHWVIDEHQARVPGHAGFARLTSIRIVDRMRLAKAAAGFRAHDRVDHGAVGLFGGAPAAARVLAPPKLLNTRRCQTDAFNASVGFSS